MILIYFLLHLLIQPAYAQEATPSATPIVASVTIAPTIAITPTTEVTPTETPVVSVSLTQTPIATAAPTMQQTTNSPTPIPAHVVNQITTPTPTPKTTQVVAHIASYSAKPIVAQVASIAKFPEDFFSYMKEGNYYQDDTHMTKEETRQLLALSAGCMSMGLLLMNWDFLAAFLSKLLKRRQLAYATEIAQENLE